MDEYHFHFFLMQKLVSCRVGARSPWCRRFWRPWRFLCHLLRSECPWRVQCEVIEVGWTSDNTNHGSRGNGGNGSANSMLSAFHVSSQVWRCLASTEGCIFFVVPLPFQVCVCHTFLILTRLGCCWQLLLSASWLIDFLSRLQWLGLASVCRFIVCYVISFSNVKKAKKLTLVDRFKQITACLLHLFVL